MNKVFITVFITFLEPLIVNIIHYFFRQLIDNIIHYFVALISKGLASIYQIYFRFQ